MTDTVQPTQQLLVADSFRVRVQDGTAQVRGFAHHAARFSETAREVGADEDDLERFLEEARRKISADSEGFPRLELWRDTDGSLRFAVVARPLPDLQHTLALVSAGDITLQHPKRKGPNIAALTELRTRLGAEPLLTTPAGEVLEGATTALIWWHGEHGHISAASDRVPSITERLISDIAASDGAPLAAVRSTPTDLRQAEVWAVNALHGIRVVTAIDGTHEHPVNEARLTYYRDALDTTWEQLT